MSPKTVMERTINNSYKHLTGIVVSKDNEIVYENYYNNYTSECKVHVASVTKSIISILIGIAIDKGYIQSVDQKVLDFFPEYTVKRGEQFAQHITLRHMLTMTATYKYKEEPYAKVWKSEDWVREGLDLLGGKEPSGEFLYAAIIGTHILSGILVKTTQMSVLDFAKENLFGPLKINMGDSIVIGEKEEQIEFTKDKNANGWVIDPKGIHTAGWGLTLSPRDMIKIGQLYLNGGFWEGKQIVSSKWVSESTNSYSHWEKYAYGYLWWIVDEKEPIFAAVGQGGNVIYVNVEKKLVIAVTCPDMSSTKDSIKLIRTYIEPVFSA